MKAGIFRQPGLAGKTRTAFEKAVELDPNNLEARSALVEYYLRAPGFLGGGEEKARAQAEEIARRDPVLGHRSRALIHREGGRDDEAEKEYQAALALDPNRADPYYWLGFLHQEKKRYDRALDVFETMLARDVDTAGALYQIGKTGALSGLKLDRAEECLRKYLETEPKAGAPPHAWAHYRLGMVHEKKGARDLARQSYEAALRLDPKLEDARKALKALR
jgi:tetratricopeptide (TPR) repeat protein